MKKQSQLGMNPSTAQGRLVKDLLFNFVKDFPCYHCGKTMTRETFSIEHRTPWLDSENPLELFFDLNNISYSHQACNIGAARKPTQKYFTPEEQRQGRIECQSKLWHSKSPEEKTAHRRERYVRYGK